MGIGPDSDQEDSFHSCSDVSVESCSEGLVPSDGSHLGSVSANSIGLDSIGDPLADGLSDQDQQERWGEGLNLAAEMEILGPEFGSEDPIVNMDANGEEGRQFIADIVRSAKDLCDIFLAILPLAFFERVAQLTEKYCYDDWVVERRKITTHLLNLQSISLRNIGGRWLAQLFLQIRRRVRITTYHF